MFDTHTISIYVIIADIPNPILVLIALAGVGNGDAVVTDIPYRITVLVYLVDDVDLGAVVPGIGNAIIVNVIVAGVSDTVVIGVLLATVRDELAVVLQTRSDGDKG